MPAVTVPDTLALPRIETTAEQAAAVRSVASVTDAPSGFEGEGFPVRRAFAGVSLSDLDPFVHMDQMGEVEYTPGEPKGTPWHPHRGFETVTYMIDGTFQHQDSIGGGGLITNGSTQWMTAGSGILHIERPPDQLDRERWPLPRDPALGEPAGGGQVDRPALSEPRCGQHRAPDLARRRRLGPRDRRRRGRAPGPGGHAHTDLHGPRQHRARSRARAAVAARVQRAPLRALGRRHASAPRPGRSTPDS